MAKNRTIPRMVGNIIPRSADTTPCAPPIIAATITPIGPKNIPNMAQRQPWSSLPPSFISFIAHLPSAPQISWIALHRRLHRGFRPLLLLHHVTAPCGGSRPMGRCARAGGVGLAEAAGRAAKRSQEPTRTRRAKQVPRDAKCAEGADYICGVRVVEQFRRNCGIIHGVAFLVGV